MPEGHTIHRMAQDHAHWFSNKTVALSSPQGRFHEGALALNGSTFDSANAYGKHLFHYYRKEGQVTCIHIHLGLYGKFRKRKNSPHSLPSPNCRLRIQSDTDLLDLSGPTCCEILTMDEVKVKQSQLGPDPLRVDGNVDRFVHNLSKRRIPIAAALLNQKVIAGLGNIYRAELLFKHRIHPLTPAHALKKSTIYEMWHTAVWWLALGVRENRIITTVDESSIHSKQLPHHESLMVYGQSRCSICNHTIEPVEIGNRRLFACFTCQIKTH